MILRYMEWLHTRWPAGTVEKLPEIREDFTTAIPGVCIVGELTGIQLLKCSSDSGARAVQGILKEPEFARARDSDPEVLDIAIVGGGVSGVAAAIEARKAGLNTEVCEATEVFSTVANFPKQKPIYTYPTGMVPAGGLQFRATVKEALLDEMEEQRRSAGIEVTYTRIERIERKDGLLLLHHGGAKKISRARRVIVAIGRSGNHRKLGVPGEELDRVYNRLYDPKDFCGQRVLVVGGGDSALETAIALATCGAHVTLSYRRQEFSRPKPENIEKLKMLERDPEARVAIEHPESERVTTAAGPFLRANGMSAGSVHLALGTQVLGIEPKQV